MVSDQVTAMLTGEQSQTNAVLPSNLNDGERTFKLLVEGVTDLAIFMLDTNGRVSNWNPGAQRIKGYSRHEIVGEHFSCFYTEEARKADLPKKALATAARTGHFETEDWRVRKDGSRFWASVTLDAIHDETGQLIGFAKITRDLTERRAMEEKLRQVQKLEAVGQLTTGIAHDFNNVLTVILGNLEILERLHPKGEDAAQSTRIARCIATATDGGRRAAALTRRLLAFSRQQALEPEAVDVNKLIDRVWELLRRTLGESIEIRTKVMPNLGLVFADAAELENAIINLAVNARDAMPRGGLLTIEATTVNSVPVQHRDGGDGDGRYIRFIVSDTGVGMSPELLSRVFEPFFTTKGRGTGLGLSQVYGFVTQSNGHIAIDSQPTFGTSVNIYLPEVTGTGADRPAVTDAVIAADSKSTDVILVVEDDFTVRAFSVDVLRSLGYSVLDAANASDALRVLESRADIGLLFTDVGLPGVMNGWQLSVAAQERYPRLKVLATTAYLRDAPAHTRAADRDIAMLTKPFTYNALANRVRDMLEK